MVSQVKAIHCGMDSRENRHLLAVRCKAKIVITKIEEGKICHKKDYVFHSFAGSDD